MLPEFGVESIILYATEGLNFAKGGDSEKSIVILRSRKKYPQAHEDNRFLQLLPKAGSEQQTSIEGQEERLLK